VQYSDPYCGQRFVGGEFVSWSRTLQDSFYNLELLYILVAPNRVEVQL
jgi:hypothetical protein